MNTVMTTPNTDTVMEPVPGKCNHLKQSGGLCKQPAGYDTDHLGYGCCKFHGGRSYSHRKAASKQIALGEAGQLLAECHIEVEGRGTIAALQELRTASGSMVMALGLLVGSLDNLVGEDGRPHVLCEMYADERERSAKVEKIAADLGLEERRVQVDETIASLVVAKVLETFVELGQDPAPYVALLAPKLAALDAVATSGKENTP